MSLFDSASLVITPNGVKEDKLYAIKPTDGSGDLVVTRTTTATRVNSDGLIEVTPYNLLQQSQTFENASWGKSAVGINTAIGTSGIQSNVANAPNGTLTADRVNFLLQSDLDLGLNQNYSLATANQSFVGSIYVKGEGSNIGKQIKLRIKRNTGGSFVTVDTTITLTSDWAEIRSSVLTLLTNNTGVQYIISSSDATNALIWGAQLVTGSSAKEYFPTTDRLDVPRLDYTNSTCPSILVEPQRTNLVTYSEEFENAVWGKANLTVTSNVTTSPNGTINADRIIENAIPGQKAITRGITIASGQAVTYSIYLKMNGRNSTSVFVYDNTFTNGFGANFNLSTGVVALNQNQGTGVLSSSLITNVGNGWYRCSISGVVGAATSLVLAAYLANGTSTSYTGDGVSGVFIWGAQLELGSNATSYIPTVASSVTRNADVISKTGISSLIGQTEGVIFLDAIILPATSANLEILSLNDNTNNNRLRIVTAISQRLRFIFQLNGGITQYDYTFGTSFTQQTRLKIAISYKSGNTAIYINGVKVNSSTNILTISNTLSVLNLGNNLGALYEAINSAQFYKTQLTDQECIDLTTI